MDGRGRFCPNGGERSGAPTSGGPLLGKHCRGIASCVEAGGAAVSFGALQPAPRWLVVATGLIATLKAEGEVGAAEEERGQGRVAQVAAGVR